jgi:sec-independent protein translocase protein TatA
LNEFLQVLVQIDKQEERVFAMVPGFHGLDLVVILVIALLIFGPKKLPEMGSAIGKSIKEFRKGMNELTAPKEEESSSNAYSAASLEAIEREIASKRAAAAADAERARAASETTGATHAETSSTEQPVE